MSVNSDNQVELEQVIVVVATGSGEEENSHIMFPEITDDNIPVDEFEQRNFELSPRSFMSQVDKFIEKVSEANRVEVV